jgi:hypothetical protein
VGVVAGKTEQLHDLLAPHLPAAVRAWLDGLKANKIAWDQVQQKMVDTGLPDHKERRESGRAIVEYLVGKAIERSMEVSGSYKDLSTLLAKLEQSPEARRLLSPELFAALAGNSGQSTAESKESAPPQESEPNPDSEQKTG